MRHLLKLVRDESLQNKKKIEESSKKGAGGDEKHIFSFTWPKLFSIGVKELYEPIVLFLKKATDLSSFDKHFLEKLIFE